MPSVLASAQKTNLQLGDEKEGLIPNRGLETETMACSMAGRGNTVCVSWTKLCTYNAYPNSKMLYQHLFNGGVLFKPQVTKWVGREEKDKIF